jgi:hypothetical protein
MELAPPTDSIGLSMSTQQYTVNQPTINTLLSWIDSNEVAIPEIQRPFVWNKVQVRNLIDSLYRGYPVGYLIAWKNPDVRLRDGTSSAGKRILIDGQQRITALMAAIRGREVMTKDYKPVRIRIAYNLLTRQFEVMNSAIARNPAWIPDIASQFASDYSFMGTVREYIQRNPEADENEVAQSLERLKNIIYNQIGLIELNHDLDIETVTEIFIRVNSSGTTLGQADFAMSKIAVNETYDGPALRKAIDYFCHLAVTPSAFSTIQNNDKAFADTPYFQKMAWLKTETDDLYDPDYSDMLRVAFTSEFRRGKLQDLVALLSGRNFDTRQNEEQIVETTFGRLSNGISHFMNETSFKNLVMIIKSAGFVSPALITSKNAINFAYIVYQTLKNEGVPPHEIEQAVRRWFAMAVLTQRYSGSSETVFDEDIRQIDVQGFREYAASIMASQLSESFWEFTLPQRLDTSANSSSAFRVFQAAQVKLGDKGFLSRDITARDLVTIKSDVHHIFPADFLKKAGKDKAQYNQVANFALTQSEINIAISNKSPNVYFAEILEQVNGGRKRYGNIDRIEDLQRNLEMNCIPEDIFSMSVDDYPEFLRQRRQLMAARIRRYFESL